MTNSLIGFVGQGYIGKNYADDFERRGFPVVRYALEEPYLANKGKIAECGLVFIAVPTPTTPQGFDDSAVREAIGLSGKGCTVIIKSTILPGTAKALQESYPDRTLFYSPEFLSGATAAYDAAHPFANILGKALDTKAHSDAAAYIHSILPPAPFTLTCDSTEAEIIKYSHNVHGYMQVVLWNMFYDLAAKFGGDWETIRSALAADPYLSHTYLSPVHKTGRGAGGHCFIKDFAALRGLYEKMVGDAAGVSVFSSMERKNIDLLRQSGKDLALIASVYGTANGKAQEGDSKEPKP